ncbi:MAG TPA: lipopolysaccharide heptosyltransferase II [Candidatus Hydrogenedentes bacterium]|nr:lipopolysaccharide heptosyltransferase II [Candidatus Hydrogenedentota bacterium]HOK88804.1 lipopolysaccharide heptosyltransferase II [Candidatus Hydrogenedentota bacterium]
MTTSRDPAIFFHAPNWLGDAVMATPALRATRANWPGYKIILAGTPTACDVLQGLSFFDETIVIPPRAGLGKMLDIARAIRRDHAVDAAIILPHSLRAALLAWLIGARRRLGIDRGGRRWFLTDPVPPRRNGKRIVPEYMVLEYLRVVAAAGGQADDSGPCLAVSAMARKRVAETLPRDERPVVAIAPGAAFGPSKRWYPERFAAVADQMAREWNATIVLLTGPGEEAIRAATRQAAHVPLREIREGGIETLKALIERADLLITNDSGPRHIAVALGTPVICVMGPTSPAYTDGPWEKGTIVRVPMPCAPCQQPLCPLEHHACMRDVTVDMVVSAARPWLKDATTRLPSRGTGTNHISATESLDNGEHDAQ